MRYAARTLRRQPGFALVAILVLGLGIGANTAMFSVIYGVLLKPLPYMEGDRLVLLQESAPLAGQDTIGISIAELYDYRQQLTGFSGLVEFHQMSFDLLNRGEPDRVDTGVVSANFFDVLGVRPRLGRTFVDGRRRSGRRGGAGAEPRILAHAVWRRPQHRRPDLPDERQAAHRRRRAAADSAVPGRLRRLHADVGLSRSAPPPSGASPSSGASSRRFRSSAG